MATRPYGIVGHDTRAAFRVAGIAIILLGVGCGVAAGGQDDLLRHDRRAADRGRA